MPEVRPSGPYAVYYSARAYPVQEAQWYHYPLAWLLVAGVFVLDYSYRLRLWLTDRPAYRLYMEDVARYHDPSSGFD